MDFYLYNCLGYQLSAKRFPPKYFHLAYIFKTKTTMTTNELGFDQLGFCFVLNPQHRFTLDSRPKYLHTVSIIIWAHCKHKIQEPALKRAPRGKSCVSTKGEVAEKGGVLPGGVWLSGRRAHATPSVHVQGAQGLCRLQKCEEWR